MKANSLEELVTSSNIAGELRNYTDWHTRLVKLAQLVADWQKEQMLKIITKDDNLEEAGTQYVETYFRDIDWTPDVIKSCLEEAFISGGEYVFKQIKYE